MTDLAPFGMPNNFTYQCPFTGNTFPFSREKGSKQNAYAAVQKCTSDEIARREKWAGRPLTYKELLQNGIAHKETRTAEQMIADHNRPKEPSPKVDWAQQQIDYYRNRPGHSPDERARIKKRIKGLEEVVKQHKKEAEAMQAETAQAAAIASNPKSQEALKHSATICNSLKYSRFATVFRFGVGRTTARNRGV